jgi:hypothetical protein
MRKKTSEQKKKKTTETTKESKKITRNVGEPAPGSAGLDS